MGVNFKMKESEEEGLGLLLIFCTDLKRREATHCRDKVPCLPRGGESTEDPNCDTPDQHVPGVTLRFI